MSAISICEQQGSGRLCGLCSNLWLCMAMHGGCTTGRVVGPDGLSHPWPKLPQTAPADLFFMLLIMMGFAVAFHVLFRKDQKHEVGAGCADAGTMAGRLGGKAAAAAAAARDGGLNVRVDSRGLPNPPCGAGVCHNHQRLPHHVSWQHGAAVALQRMRAPGRPLTPALQAQSSARAPQRACMAHPFAAIAGLLRRYANQDGLLDLGLMRSSHNPVRFAARRTAGCTKERQRREGAAVLGAEALRVGGTNTHASAHDGCLVRWLQVSAVLLAVGYGEQGRDA